MMMHLDRYQPASKSKAFFPYSQPMLQSRNVKSFWFPESYYDIWELSRCFLWPLATETLAEIDAHVQRFPRNFAPLPRFGCWIY